MKINLAGLSLAVAFAVMTTESASAAGGIWDLDANPTNGFSGATLTWGLSDPGSFVAEWNLFDSTNDSTPELANFGLTSVSVNELTGTAFLTSGLNIYSFAAATDFDVSANPSGSPVSGSNRVIAIRLATLGSGVDSSSVVLDGVGPTTSTRTYVQSITGGFGGDEEEWLFIWENVAIRAAYQVQFNASASSMSLDQFALYGSAPIMAISAEIDVDTAILPVHPDHDGSPQSVGGIQDVIRVIVIGLDTSVGDSVNIDVDDIVASSVRFGPDAARKKRGSVPQHIDYDSDGLDDSRFRFLTGDTGISCTDTEVTMTGELLDGTQFIGLDSLFESECDTQCH